MKTCETWTLLSHWCHFRLRQKKQESWDEFGTNVSDVILFWYLLIVYIPKLTHTQRGKMIKLIQVLWITMMIYFFAMGESSHRLMLSKGIGCFYPWKIDSKRTLVRLLVEHSETLTVFQVWTSSNLSSLGRFKSFASDRTCCNCRCSVHDHFIKPSRSFALNMCHRINHKGSRKGEACARTFERKNTTESTARKIKRLGVLFSFTCNVLSNSKIFLREFLKQDSLAICFSKRYDKYIYYKYENGSQLTTSPYL